MTSVQDSTQASQLGLRIARQFRDCAIDPVRRVDLQSDATRQLRDSIGGGATAIVSTRLQDRVANLRFVLVGEHVIVRENVDWAASALPNETTDGTRGDQ